MSMCWLYGAVAGLFAAVFFYIFRLLLVSSASDRESEVGATYSGNRSGSLPRQGFDSPAPCPSTSDSGSPMHSSTVSEVQK